MKSLIKPALFLAINLSIVFTASAAGDGWLTSYDDAVKISKKSGKPIMVDFTGSDWCSWCIKLHNEVFNTPEFKKWAKSKVVLLELDFPRRTPQPDALREQNARLNKKFRPYVSGFPTVLFLKPDGSLFGKYGYEPGGPKNWTVKADRLFSNATR